MAVGSAKVKKVSLQGHGCASAKAPDYVYLAVANMVCGQVKDVNARNAANVLQRKPPEVVAEIHRRRETEKARGKRDRDTDADGERDAN